LAERLPIPAQFYAALRLIKHVDRRAVGRMLAEHREAVQNRIKQGKERQQSTREVLASTIMELCLRLAEAELSWVEGLIKRIDKK